MVFGWSILFLLMHPLLLNCMATCHSNLHDKMDDTMWPVGGFKDCVLLIYVNRSISVHIQQKWTCSLSAPYFSCFLSLCPCILPSHFPFCPRLSQWRVPVHPEPICSVCRPVKQQSKGRLTPRHWETIHWSASYKHSWKISDMQTRTHVKSQTLIQKAPVGNIIPEVGFCTQTNNVNLQIDYLLCVC